MEQSSKATRYIASLRPAMRPEAERIAREHLTKGEFVADCEAILEALAATA
jgi:hypothetical protein